MSLTNNISLGRVMEMVPSGDKVNEAMSIINDFRVCHENNGKKGSDSNSNVFKVR